MNEDFIWPEGPKYFNYVFLYKNRKCKYYENIKENMKKNLF